MLLRLLEFLLCIYGYVASNFNDSHLVMKGLSAAHLKTEGALIKAHCISVFDLQLLVCSDREFASFRLTPTFHH